MGSIPAERFAGVFTSMMTLKLVAKYWLTMVNLARVADDATREFVAEVENDGVITNKTSLTQKFLPLLLNVIPDIRFW